MGKSVTRLDLVRRLRKRGDSLREIAKAMKISISTVKRDIAAPKKKIKKKERKPRKLDKSTLAKIVHTIYGHPNLSTRKVASQLKEKGMDVSKATWSSIQENQEDFSCNPSQPPKTPCIRSGSPPRHPDRFRVLG